MLGQKYMSNKHDLEPVIHYDWPNGWSYPIDPSKPIYSVPKEEPSGFFCCKKCGLMGRKDGWAFKTYNCEN